MKNEPVLVKMAGSPEVYWIDADGVLHHVPDGPTLEARWSWNDVEEVSIDDFESQYKGRIGYPLPSTAKG